LGDLDGDAEDDCRLLMTFAAISGFAAVPELARYCFSL